MGHSYKLGGWLHCSMLAHMETADKPYYTHLLFWAPFVVAGEGTRL